MPKILIIESTQVDYGDDRGGQHVDNCEIVDVPKEQARKLTEYNRALYVSKTDDPTKAAIYTASKEMLDAAKQVAAARAKPKEASEQDK